MQKKLFAAAIVVLLVLGLSGCHFAFKRYVNKEFGYSILLPRFWDKKEIPTNSVVMLRGPVKNEGDFHPNIAITASVLPQDVKFDFYFELNKELIMEGVPGAKYSTSEGTIYAGGVKGKWFAFSSNLKDYALNSVAATWMKGRNVYAVVCSCEEKDHKQYEQLFQKVIRSIKFLKNN